MSTNVLSIKVAWRNILRQRGYSLIYVLGLSIGICVCMVIYIIGRYELGFDKFHPGAERIYRIVGDVQDKDGNVIFLNSPFKEVARVEQLIAGFGPSAAFHIFGGRIFVPDPKGGGQIYDSKQAGGYAQSTILTGPEFFTLFPHGWLVGDPGVLSQPGRIVLAESVAHRYFGKVPVGQMLDRTVIYDDSLIVRVAGIVRDWEQPSDLGYTSFISLGTATVNPWLQRRIPRTDWSSLQPRRS